LSGREATRREVIEDALAPFALAQVLTGFESEGHEHFVETRDYGGVRDSELFFDIFDLATGAKEGLHECELVAAEARKRTRFEVALDGDAARAALQAANLEGAVATRAGSN